MGKGCAPYGSLKGAAAYALVYGYYYYYGWQGERKGEGARKLPLMTDAIDELSTVKR